MNDEKRINKRKVLMRYLILAACILLIATATVLTICAANNWFKPSVTDTAGKDDDTVVTPPDDKDDNDGDDEDDNKPTNADTSWASPVATVNVITPYDFIEDVTLKNRWHFHTGIDFAAAAGTTVSCCYDGVIESIITGDELDGNKITVSHANGVKTTYSFIDVNPDLKVGDTVKRGTTLGTVSEPTGKECMLEAHLHFEVYENGETADPDKYLDVNLK